MHPRNHAVLLLIATLALAGSASLAAAAQVPLGPAGSVHLEFAEVPSCQVRLGDGVCLLGHDDGGTQSNLSDDTFYFYQATERVSVKVNTKLLGPAGEVLPNQIAVNSRTTTVEHPAFTTLGRLAKTFNEMRPAPAKPFIEARHGEGGTILILFLEPLTRDTPLPKNAGVLVDHNWWNVTDYKRIRPINNDLVNVTSTDAQVDEWFDGAWLSKMCRNAGGIPTEELAPGACDGLGSARSLVGTHVKEATPNVVCCAATTGGEIVFHPSRDHLLPKHDSLEEQPRPVDSQSLSAGPPIRLRQETTISKPRVPPISGLLSASDRELQVDGAARRVDTTVAPIPNDWLLSVAITGAVFAILIAVLYSRLSREKLLVNENRRAIYDVIMANPGITVGEVRARLDLNYHTVERHVNRLLAAGMLTSRQDGRKKCLFENGGKYDAQRRTLMTLLRPPVAQRVALGLLRASEMTQSELARRLQIPASTVSFHTRKLAAHGALDTTKRSRNRVFSLRPDWRMVIADCLEARGHDLATRVRKSS